MIKLGFLGGGLGSIAGGVHLAASRLDGKFQVVGGIFSGTPERSREAANTYGVKDFKSLGEMCEAVDIVVILTPTPAHYGNLLELANYNVGIICDKPLTSTTKEAKEIKHLYESRFVVVTHNYSGYPMVRELREMIRHNLLGDIKNIIINMPRE